MPISQDSDQILSRELMDKAGQQNQLGSALIKSGFGLLGAGVAERTGNKAAGQVYANLGEDIVSILQDRWWKNEYRNFQQTAGSILNQRVQDIYNKYLASTTLQPMPHTQARTGQPKQLPQTQTIPAPTEGSNG